VAVARGALPPTPGHAPSEEPYPEPPQSIRFPRIFPDSPKFISINPSLNTFYLLLCKFAVFMVGLCNQTSRRTNGAVAQGAPRSTSPATRPSAPSTASCTTSCTKTTATTCSPGGPPSSGSQSDPYPTSISLNPIYITFAHFANFFSSGKVTYMILLPTIFSPSIGMYARCISQCALTTKLRINFDSQHVPPPILHLSASICLGLIFY